MNLYLTAERIGQLDYLEQKQLLAVLEVCKHSQSISEASRTLFNVSRTQKSTSNDADRLRKYLAKYQLSWQNIHPVSAIP